MVDERGVNSNFRSFHALLICALDIKKSNESSCGVAAVCGGAEVNDSVVLSAFFFFVFQIRRWFLISHNQSEQTSTMPGCLPH